MTNRWKSFVKDYLTFSLRERVGLLILVMIGVSVYFLPKLLKPKREPIKSDAFQKEIAGLKIWVDSSKANRNYKRYNDDDDDHYAFYPRPPYKKESTTKGELFNFDPNTLDEDGWKRLGVRDKTVQTIMKFVGKGYTFRKPEDIKKIYGLGPEEAERLMPYVHIAGKEKAPDHVYTASSAATYDKKTPPPAAIKIIDVNEADTAAFISLPGIGSKLASRIVNFRDKLGGFASINQVGETYGVPDSTFQLIKPRLQCNHPALKTININNADVNVLKAHPYLRWNMANAIVSYRQQHGTFKSVDELKKIDIITPQVFDKIAPYLIVSN